MYVDNIISKKIIIEHNINHMKEKNYRIVALKVMNTVWMYKGILLLFELFEKNRREEI